MALILNIETATSVCSVALAKEGKILGIKENTEGLNHSLLLGTFIQALFEECALTAHDLDAVAVSMGPGSYTGLRIGVSMAKGLCFGASKPLIAINTLQALARSVSEQLKEDAWYCPMIDARRMEVYTAFFDSHNRTMLDTKAEIIDEHSFSDILATHKVYFFGDGSEKVKNTLVSPHACYLNDKAASAAHLVEIAEQKFAAQQFESVAYFEPFYLKDFIATTPKHKIA